MKAVHLSREKVFRCPTCCGSEGGPYAPLSAERVKIEVEFYCDDYRKYYHVKRVELCPKHPRESAESLEEEAKNPYGKIPQQGLREAIERALE